MVVRSVSEISGFLKWSGFAALFAGVLTIALDVWDFVLTGDQPVSVTAMTGGWIALHASYLAADVLILIGLVGIWLAQEQRAGALGVVGFVIAFFGTVTLAGLEWSTAFVFPWLAGSNPGLLDADPSGAALAGFIVTVLLVTVGWLVLGVASLRARVYRRGPVWLLILGTVGVLVLGSVDAPFLDVLWGAGVAWLGYEIWSRTSEAHVIATST